MRLRKEWLGVALAAVFLLLPTGPLYALQAGINIDVHQDVPCQPFAQNCPNDFHIEGLVCSNNGTLPVLVDHVDDLFAPPNGLFTYSIVPAGLPDPCYYRFTANWQLVGPSMPMGIPYCTVLHLGLLFDVDSSNIVIDLKGWWTRDGVPIGQIRPLPNQGFIPVLGFSVTDATTGQGAVLRIANGSVVQPPLPPPFIPIRVVQMDVVAFPPTAPPDFRELRLGGAQETYPWVKVLNENGAPIEPGNPLPMMPDSFFDVFLEMMVPGQPTPVMPVPIPPGGFLVARSRIAFQNNDGVMEERWQWEIHGAQPPEACCFDDGSCMDLLPFDCLQLGGHPRGVGSICAQTICPVIERGACCYGTAAPSCLVTDQITCEQQLMGVWKGPGTDCSDLNGDGVADICEPPVEPVACCLWDGTCLDMPADACVNTGGHPRQPGSSCGALLVPCLNCDWNPDMAAKWVQLPDTTPMGIDIRVDRPDLAGQPTAKLADDWLCTEPGKITDIHFWGSWKGDRKGQIKWIHATIWSDQPASEQSYSMPAQLLWDETFMPDEFTEKLFTVVPGGEWWWDPASQELLPNGDTQIWQVNICIDPTKHELFVQRGTPREPVVYWLGLEVQTVDDVPFGWKTRDPSQHFNDSAVRRTTMLPPWAKLSYPSPHPLFEKAELDLAFALTGEALPPERDWGDAPDSPLIAGYPTLAFNLGANHIISPNYFLGAMIDAEGDGQPDAAATGDDLALSDDEDGVIFLNTIARGRWTKVDVTASAPGFLNAWLDFNRDGDWADPGEQIFTNTPLVAGLNNLSFRTPGWASAGVSFARFRYDSAGGLSFAGPARDGEVEDYQVRIRPAKIVGRHIFYNQSAWDGNNPGANAQDDNAIAPDKTALLPGIVGAFRNYISYNKSINGLMIDVEDLPEMPLGVGDLTFTNTGRDFSMNVPVPVSSVNVRPGAGVGGSDRITVIFANNQLPNSSWLKVRMLATPTTGLEADDVHYWGVAFGESGNNPLDAVVNATDQNGAKNNPVTFPSIAPLTNRYDYNRDQRVNATDQNVAKNNTTTFLTALRLLAAP